ncbi:MAG: GIY-YIG nuclease family protein [Candidatus Aenigmarchaeota archaeon]|nr:GIY-YIG nuclease family protein [Candidatus Aenigmarchaeota archaeon]
MESRRYNKNKKWKWYVYILECKNNTYYTGLTWKPGLRYDQHLSGLGGRYTKKYKVKRLVYSEGFENLELARKREIQIKNWSQEKKKKLIEGIWSKEW